MIDIHQEDKTIKHGGIMIREIRKTEISECVKVIRESFLTVADEFGFTPENAPRFTAFATTEERLDWQLTQEHRPMYAAFHDSGYMEKVL